MIRNNTGNTVAVRLTPRELRGLRNAFEKVFQEDVLAVYLFGSRTDLNEKGGDIDLLVKCGKKPAFSVTRLARALRLAIYAQIGEQKIDIVWDYPEKTDAFVRMLDDDKILLWEKTNGK